MCLYDILKAMLFYWKIFNQISSLFKIKKYQPQKYLKYAQANSICRTIIQPLRILDIVYFEDVEKDNENLQ